MSLFHLEMDNSSLVGQFTGNFGGGAPANIGIHIFIRITPTWDVYNYFDKTDGYLRFISTVGQTTVPFFSQVVIFSGCNLNPLGQTTVPFFLVVFFPVIYKYHNWCLCQNTNTNYDPKKLRPEKKGTVVWPAMFFNYNPKKKGTVIWRTVEINLR